MSTQQTKAKQGSRWGNFFSGAVEGLESRLDKILAEDNARAAAAAKQIPRSAVPEKKDASVDEQLKTPQNHSRSSSVTRSGTTPSIAHKEFQGSPTGLGDSSQSPSLKPASRLRVQTPSPAPSEAKSRPSIESTSSDRPAAVGVGNGESYTTTASEQRPIERDEEDTSISIETSAIEGEDPNIFDASSGGKADDVLIESVEIPEQSNDYQAQIAHLQKGNENLELQRQEEVHAHLERIDALQAKLQYLAREAVDSARQAAIAAPADTFEQKLASKDEQIALLMEEGQKLSKAEVTHATTIKKLRAKMAEDGKALTIAQRKVVEADKSSSEMVEKVTHLESMQKEQVQKLSRLNRLEREVEELKIEKDTKQTTIEDLKSQVKTATAKANEEEKQVNAQALEVERKRVQSLQEDLSNARIEKQLGDDRHKAELKTAHEEVEREKERSKSAEQGLRNEISILEGRLEIFRERSEEASSGATGDSQAKLMRQVETLQSQYALASENWQQIEGSLQSRITALEKERDDASRQESETRRKLRESSSASRRSQEQVEELTIKNHVLEQELNERQVEIEKLQSRVDEFERSLQEAQEEFEQEKRSWDSTLITRIEEEKQKWKQEANQYLAPETPGSYAESPVGLSRRTSGLEMFPQRKAYSRHASTELSIPGLDRMHSRKSSALAGRSLDVQSPTGGESGRSTPILNGHVPPETPSINPADQDDMLETSSSPHRTVNDMISNSTVGAGPSVQLVERMSATVRRLESEKAASKDELNRLTTQRDEARKEVVSLMREVEEKRAADAKIKKLEGDIQELQRRYQTTLEMLGEKSERVDELSADVDDLKKIYRELVENTVT